MPRSVTLKYATTADRAIHSPYRPVDQRDRNNGTRTKLQPMFTNCPTKMADTLLNTRLSNWFYTIVWGYGGRIIMQTEDLAAEDTSLTVGSMFEPMLADTACERRPKTCSRNRFHTPAAEFLYTSAHNSLNLPITPS